MESRTTHKPNIEKQIVIHAEPQKVWETMLDPEAFKIWCAAFMPGSFYRGEWSEGSIIRFLGADEEGKEHGMVTKIVEYNPYSLIRAEHIGVVEAGQDRFEGDVFDEWIPSIEEYQYDPAPEGTTLKVRTSVPESHREDFEKSWDEALSILKSLVEQPA